MIVGEHEIQGQVRRAHEPARDSGDDRARSPTASSPPRSTPAGACAPRPAIARSQVSLSSVAVELAERLLGELGGRPVVVIGAGETSELTAQALAARGVNTIFIANRHADRARSVAAALRRRPSSASSAARRRSKPPTSSSPRPPRPTRSSAARSSSS